jgi:ABC-type multidrug transport system ATPase subunit
MDLHIYQSLEYEMLTLRCSLDDDTSAIIEDVLSSRFTSWTVIAIAHKLDSIVGFDKVAVLDGGQLVEFDAPEVLLAEQSMFRDLYKYSQTGASKMLLRRSMLSQRKAIERKSMPSRLVQEHH